MIFLELTLIVLVLLGAGTLGLISYSKWRRGELERQARGELPQDVLSAHAYYVRLQRWSRVFERLRANDMVWPMIPERDKELIEKELRDFYDE